MNDQVELPTTMSIFGDGWQSTKTVNVWVKPEGVSPTCAYSTVAACDAILGDRPEWWGIHRGVLNGQDRIWVWNWDASAGSPADILGIPYVAGEWVHISLVHADGVLHAYRNGIEIASTASGPTQQPLGGALPRLYIGGYIFSTTRNYTLQGDIDEVSLWRTARSTEEIQHDMLNPLTGSEPGLMAYYPMSDGAGSVLSDLALPASNGRLLDGGSGVLPNGSLPLWITSNLPGWGGTPQTSTPLPPTSTSTATGTATATPTVDLTPPPPTPTSTPTPTAGPPTPTASATSTAPVPTPTQPSGGTAGYALRFDGVNDRVELPTTLSIFGDGWQSTKTVNLWVRPTGTSPVCANSAVGACDVVFGDKPQSWGISRGVLNSQDRLWVWNWDASVGSPADVIGISYTPGEWVHVSLVHADGVLRAYKNGVEVGSTASGASAQPSSTAKLNLGGVIFSSTRNYTLEGELDEVSLWRTARTAEEIAYDMLNPLSGSEGGLAAYYAMSNGSGTVLTDDSQGSANGVLLDGGSGVPSNGSLPLWVPSDVPLNLVASFLGRADMPLVEPSPTLTPDATAPFTATIAATDTATPGPATDTPEPPTATPTAEATSDPPSPVPEVQPSATPTGIPETPSPP